MNLKTSSQVETRTLLEEVCNFDRKGLFDLGHPLVNRIAESFVKAAGIGAVQAVSRDAYFIATQGLSLSLSLSTYYYLHKIICMHNYCFITSHYIIVLINFLRIRTLFC
jgi:hypothetical protein